MKLALLHESDHLARWERARRLVKSSTSRLSPSRNTFAEINTAANMPSCCLIFSGFLTILVSIIVGMYFNRIMPEGMSDDQFTGLRVLSVGSDVIEFLVGEQQLVEKPFCASCRLASC